MLRSAGVALGLPMLEAMAVSPVCRGVAELPAEPRRLVLVGQPLGMYGPNFFPQQSGPQYEASRYLSAVERHRGQLTVFSGMSHHYPAGHFAEVALFTGVSLWLGTQDRPEIPGVNLGHHDASHHGQDPAKLEQLALIEEAEMRVLGEFLDRLRETQEDGETLLDRTAVLYASNLGNSSSHDNSNLPVLLAGGRFRHRGHVVSDLRNNVRMSNLFVRMLRHLGQEAERFGASDGVISEI